ncbi:MAG: glyoxalase/bleomycin resistance/extradiol dioxygenase family protein [Myxococcales bacterium]|nr:MAG: glyoxalase/bleomycin resistance/extradiol dioxygenase family protein [Myxococcales bacterium]
MTIRSATPYLFFCGDASRAISLYERALGARVTGRMNYGQGPAGGPISPQDSDRIMHAALSIGGVQLMLSDSPISMDVPADRRDASNVHVSLDFDDVADMHEKFDALARGGTVRIAIHDAFWGKFGMLTDEFGINWMFSFTNPTT